MVHGIGKKKIKTINFSFKQPPKLGKFCLLWKSKVSKDTAWHLVGIASIFLPNSFVEGHINLETLRDQQNGNCSPNN